jgi:hypothetical protein
MKIRTVRTIIFTVAFRSVRRTGASELVEPISISICFLRRIKMLSRYSRFVASRNIKLQTASLSSSAPKVKNFINGKFEESKTTQWIDLYNPATQELVCRVPQSTPEELQRAEQGAIEAFQTWKEVPVQQRQVLCTIKLPCENARKLTNQNFPFCCAS